MESVKTVIVRYQDAAYKYRKTHALPPILYGAIGVPIRFGERFVVLAFGFLDGMPDHGLLLPYRALVVRTKTKQAPAISKTAVGKSVSIDWEDVTHFTNGAVPDSISTVYTEGVLTQVTDECVVVDSPESVAFLGDGAVENHPARKPQQYIIPRLLITRFVVHES